MRIKVDDTQKTQCLTDSTSDSKDEAFQASSSKDVVQSSEGHSVDAKSTHHQTNRPFKPLPTVLMLHIFKFSSNTDLLTLAWVNKEFKKYVEDSKVDKLRDLMDLLRAHIDPTSIPRLEGQPTYSDTQHPLLESHLNETSSRLQSCSDKNPAQINELYQLLLGQHHQLLSHLLLYQPKLNLFMSDNFTRVISHYGNFEQGVPAGRLLSTMTRYKADQKVELTDAACSSIVTLIDQGADVNVVDDEKSTPLMNAILIRKETVFNAVLQSRAVKIDAYDDHGNNALSLAIFNAPTQYILNLLKRKANPNIDTGRGTALAEAIKSSGRSTEVVKILLDHKADPNIPNMHYRETPLIVSARLTSHLLFPPSHKERLKTMDLLLDQKGINVNALASCNFTAVASAIGDIRTASGPLVAQKDTRFATKMVKRMVAKGANLTLQNSSGETALIQATKKAQHSTKLLEYLLSLGKDAINIDAVDKEGNTALMHAVKEYNLVAIKLLLTHGSNPSIPDKLKKMTPLMLLVKKESSVDVISNLIKHKEFKIDAKDIKGNTALMHALQIPEIDEIRHSSISFYRSFQKGNAIKILENRYEYVKLLLLHGASLKLQNNSGQTAIDCLIQSENKDMADIKETPLLEEVLTPFIHKITNVANAVEKHSDYESIIQKACIEAKTITPFQKIIALFNDYANPKGGWFLSGAWGRHADNMKIVNTLLPKLKIYQNEIQSASSSELWGAIYTKIKSWLDELETSISKTESFKPTGELSCRIAYVKVYILSELSNSIKIQSKPETEGEKATLAL